MSSYDSEQQLPRGTEVINENSHGRKLSDNQENPKKFPAMRKSHSTGIGINRPLTPARVHSADGSSRLSVYRFKDLEKRKDKDIIQRSCSADAVFDNSEVKTSTLPVDIKPKPADMNTNKPAVKMRNNSARNPRPSSLFISSEPTKIPLSCSQSADSNFYEFPKESTSPVERKFPIKTSSSSRLEQLQNSGNISSRRGSLPRMPFTQLYPFRSHEKASTPPENWKNVVLRKKKDSPKEAAAKNNNRKSLPSVSGLKRNSVANFWALRNVFNRSASNNEATETAKNKSKTALYSRRQSLPAKEQSTGNLPFFRRSRKDRPGNSTLTPSFSVGPDQNVGWRYFKESNSR